MNSKILNFSRFLSSHSNGHHNRYGNHDKKCLGKKEDDAGLSNLYKLSTDPRFTPISYFLRKSASTTVIMFFLIKTHASFGWSYTSRLQSFFSSCILTSLLEIFRNHPRPFQLPWTFKGHNPIPPAKTG